MAWSPRAAGAGLATTPFLPGGGESEGGGGPRSRFRYGHRGGAASAVGFNYKTLNINQQQLRQFLQVEGYGRL